MTRDLREAAEVSMGTEITIVDEVSIKALADQARRLFFFFAVVYIVITTFRRFCRFRFGAGGL